MTNSEYATIVLAAVQEDIKHVHVRATVSAALAAVFLTQVGLDDLRGLKGREELPLFAALVLLPLAAVLYFHYTQLLNRARLRIVERLSKLESPGESVTADIAAAGGEFGWIAQPWSSKFMATGGWSRLAPPRVYYFLAQASFVLGAVAASVVIYLLVGE